jgi:hypothetical protein
MDNVNRQNSGVSVGFSRGVIQNCNPLEEEYTSANQGYKTCFSYI